MSKKLVKYIINTCVDAEDIIASTLFDYGIEGVEIDDKVGLSEKELKEQYVDIPMELTDDGKAKVIFYVEIVSDENEKCKKVNIDNKILDNSYNNNIYNQYTEDEIEKIVNNILNDLDIYKKNLDMGSLIIEKEDLTGFDYMNKWKEYFKKIYIDDICIMPSFEKPDENDKNKIIINIDPKGAFGTGNHQTTKLCIEEIVRQIKNNNIENMLDIGCGSGILGIVAKKMGVKNILSIDVDENIKDTIYENIDINGINKKDFEYIIGNIITDDNIKEKVGKEKYDIITANILAPVIISLITDGEIDKYMKKGSVLITSGILDKYEKDVVDAIKRNKNLELIDVKYKDEWVNVNIRKK